jgi:signal transduction histidine kinase
MSPLRLGQSVRLRLALIYGGLSLGAGAILVALIYVLVRYSPFPMAPAAPAAPGASVDGLGGSASTLTNQDEVLRRLLANSGIALTVMAGLAILLGWFMAGRALRPIAAMTTSLRRITADRLDRRLALSGPADEITELAATVDELLERLESAFTAQRRFIANASHELRTPLTLQQALAEVALADPQADTETLRAALNRVLAAGQAQERLIEALLSLARSHQGLHEHRSFDLAEVVRDALAQCTETNVRIDSSLQPAPTSGDPALIDRLVANLLDNAIRHNNADGWLSVATGLESGRPTLVIANSGPMISPDQVARMLEPFQRLGAGRRSTSTGLGLGLSIVAAVVDAHRGALDVRPRPQGGLRIRVTLPPDRRARP